MAFRRKKSFRRRVPKGLTTKVKNSFMGTGGKILLVLGLIGGAIGINLMSDKWQEKASNVAEKIKGKPQA